VACAGIAAGADGLIVEVHAHPEQALSDGGQSLKPDRFADLVTRTRAIAQAVGRSTVPARHDLSKPVREGEKAK
jgi:3-deoxy-7-phosphoheptulonate synthase